MHLSKAALNEDVDDSNDTPTANESILQGSIRQLREGGREIRSFLSGHGLVIIFMFCYVFVAVSKVVQVMLLQYATKRYNWSWSKVCQFSYIPVHTHADLNAQASFLLTTRSIVSLVVLILILPAMTQLLTKRFKVSVIQRDVWIARVTGLAGVLGALLIALASTPEILILGMTCPNPSNRYASLLIALQVSSLLPSTAV